MLIDHYTTSSISQIQQWVVWKESVANCKHYKAITSLLFSRVGVWSKSGFKGLFSNFKGINIQHWPCCQSSMTSAVFKTTGNSELGNLRLQWVQDNWELEEKKQTGKIRFERSSNSEFQVGNSGLFLELQPEDPWHHDSTLSQLSWKHHKSREWQTLTTKFDDKMSQWRTAPPTSCSSEYSTRRVQKGCICCCINDVIWQGDMYTVVKKVILSVCCVVSC